MAVVTVGCLRGTQRPAMSLTVELQRGALLCLGQSGHKLDFWTILFRLLDGFVVGKVRLRMRVRKVRRERFGRTL